MAGSRSTNHGGKGQRERPPMTKKKRTEDDRRHHYHGKSDVENEMNGEESSPDNSRTSKNRQRTKRISEAKWASEEEDNGSVSEYEECNNGTAERTMLEEEVAEGKKAYNTLLAQWGDLKRETQELRNQNKDMKKEATQIMNENRELKEKVRDLEAEQERSLQESAATEVIVVETYGKVGKFVKDELFHHKKFINDDYDLNDITDDGSVGKQTMDHFGITQSRRVAWWNTYKKAAADAIANQRSAVASNVKRELKGKSQTWKRKGNGSNYTTHE